MRYRAKRIYTWSPDIAYSVGLMASDGCLQSNGRHLDLTSIDLDQLQNFSQAIGKTLTISQKNNKSKTTAYRVQFSDVAYYDFLMRAGLTPAKSNTLGEIHISDLLYGHFLRGVYDGDGSSNGYFDKRWKSSYLFYIYFYSASLRFAEFLDKSNQRLAGVKSRKLQLKNGVYCLAYSKSDAYKIYNLMYGGSANSIYLIRKRERLENFMKEDNNATISRLQARVL